jgi:hypothetical protein
MNIAIHQYVQYYYTSIWTIFSSSFSSCSLTLSLLTRKFTDEGKNSVNINCNKHVNDKKKNEK